MRWRRRLGALAPLVTPGVLFPALMSLMVFFVLTDILYSGGRRENFAGKVEKQLIEKSLRFAAYDAVTPGAVVTVSFRDQDLARMEAAPSTLVRDAHLREYAAVTERLLALEPKLLVLGWLTSAHPTDAEYLEPLAAALRTAPDPSRVIVAYPIGEIGALPPTFRREFQVKEGEDCIYEVNSYCTYNPSWNTWLLQSLAERLWPDPPRHHVSDDLPHVLPNFILNVPRRETIPDLSASDVLAGVVPPSAVKGRVVFVGNDSSQDPRLKDNKPILRRTFTAVGAGGSASLLEDGTPLHVFWAQMAQMFIDRTTLAVAPSYVGAITFVAIAIAILLTMLRVGQAGSLALLLLAAVAAPTLNALSVAHLHLYVPLFAVGYGTLLVYIFSAFWLMSFRNFRQSKLESERRSYGLMADLKGNFVSLISHNLNTPVAKLLGLVDVLTTSRRLPEWDETLHACRTLATQMQFLVKSALLSTSLEQPTSRSRSNLKAILHEFEQSSRPLLRRLGLDLEVPVGPQGVSDDVLFSPCALDPRHGAHALAAMTVLLAGQRQGALQCKARLEGEGPEALLRLDVEAPVDWEPSPEALEEIRRATTDQQGLHAPDKGDFLTAALSQYVRGVARTYGGRLVFVPAAGHGTTLALVLPPPP